VPKNDPKGGGQNGGDARTLSEETPSLHSICVSDGMGKVCNWWTLPWGRTKKRIVVPFFVLCSIFMVGYNAVLSRNPDTIPAEKSLSLAVAGLFLGVALILAMVKRPKLPDQDEDTVGARAGNVEYSLEMDLTVQTGSVVMVIGSVGAGKSSVIQAILGEMEKTGGQVDFAQSARVSYCSQQAWLANASVKENIISSNPLDERRYQRVRALG
jgi:hypothetical protein